MTRWTEDQWQEYLARQKDTTLPDALRQIGLQVGLPPDPASSAAKPKGKTRKDKASPPVAVLDGAGETGEPKAKRRGVSVSPIMHSLQSPIIQVRANQDDQTLAMWFGGARLLSVNELFSIFQFRKYEAFAYKKRWKALVGEALALLPGDKPRYTGTVRLTLYRSGKRLIDLDSFAAIFKYIIDGLREHGVLLDDNPWVVARIEPWQVKGDTAVGIRVEPMDPPAQPTEDVRAAWGLVADDTTSAG